MITSYSWIQTEGSSVRLNGADTKTASFKIWNCILSATAAPVSTIRANTAMLN